MSILDLARLRGLLGIPERLVPVAYLCIGYVSEFPRSPDLERAGWERRERLAKLIHFDCWGARDESRAAQMIPAPNGEDPA